MRNANMVKVISSLCVLAMIPGQYGCNLWRDRSLNGQVVEFHLAQVAPAPGLKLMDALVPDSGFYVESRPIVSDIDIASARVERIPRGLVMHIRLTEDGASRLTRVTHDHIGSRLALVVNGRLVVAPLIIESANVLSDRSFSFAVDMPAASVEQTMAAVAARWKE